MVTNSGKLGAELMRLSRDGFSLQSILSWSKGIKQADTSTNYSKKQTQSHRDRRPSNISKIYRFLVTLGTDFLQKDLYN